jgi:predicted HicB family RNase H-like nuclease
MALTDARKKANKKYDEKRYDRISIMVKKGKKDEIKAFAAKTGESLNRFISRAIDEVMEKESAYNKDGDAI